jgi:hypothetical protein
MRRAKKNREVVQHQRHIRKIGSGIVPGQLALHAQRFLVGALAIRHPLRVFEKIAQVVQCRRHRRKMGTGVVLGQLTPDPQRVYGELLFRQATWDATLLHPFLRVIDSKRALKFGEAQAQIHFKPYRS